MPLVAAPLQRAAPGQPPLLAAMISAVAPSTLTPPAIRHLWPAAAAAPVALTALPVSRLSVTGSVAAIFSGAADLRTTYISRARGRHVLLRHRRGRSLPRRTVPAPAAPTYGRPMAWLIIFSRIFIINLTTIEVLMSVIASLAVSAVWMNAAEEITDEITHMKRIAPVLKFNDTPNLGGAGPGVPPTLQKRGPPALRTGSGGRLPNWTSYNLQLGYRYKITTLGTCCAAGPTARRASAMVRLGSAMAMALTAAMKAAEPVVEVSRPTTASILAQAADLATTHLVKARTTVEGIGVVGFIVPYTPGHSAGYATLTKTYGMNVSRPTWAARGVARSLSSVSARGPAETASAEVRRNQDGPITYEGTHIIIVVYHVTGYGKTDWARSDGSRRPMTANLAIANHIASNLALTSPEPLRRRRRA